MANTAEDFENALVFVYSKYGDLITKTSVSAYDPDEKYIDVAEGLDSIEPKTRLQLLVVHRNGANEFSGIFETGIPGGFRVLIYDEHQRDVRVSVRRTINATAVISDMVTESETGTFDEPLPVMIENMSTTGVLVKSGRTRMDIGALLQIELRVDERTGILYGEVLREQRLADGTFGYGCKLYFFNK